MARGVMKHGTTKTFLTRGVFGIFLRPIIYSETDKIHFEFLKIITKTIKSIDREINSKYRGVLQIWFSMAPKEHFELLFLPDENIQTMIPMLEKAEVNNGEECAIMTQGFILYNLEQIIKNSTEYRNTIRINVPDLESICDIIFDKKSKQRIYWDYFRNELKNEDPRNIPIIYVYEATSLFITDNNRKKIVIQSWDDDLLGKFAYINGFANFIQIQKENSIKML
ncbi:hypothetical protein [Mariniphaga sp.]|uniref:hypothetical protein n=1 Tax=Mariniphaga sp. TaxID=1954475 RepID=UPI00356420F1